MSSSFVYDVLPEGSIRLLELLDAQNDSETITFNLRTYRLDDAPDFNALSYVWGANTNKRQVRCISKITPDGALLSITPNLFEALPFIKAASARPIWIDAICINQNDLKEKARVVPRMGDYYGLAKDVLIWLGPCGNDSDLAMDVLNWMGFPKKRDGLQRHLCGTNGPLNTAYLAAILSVLQSKKKVTIVQLDLKRLGLPIKDHPLWLALPALYRREWFSRLWTFQEAMLARNATVLCGDRTIPWEAFTQLGQDMTDTELLWINQPSGTFTNLRHFQWPHNNGEWFWQYLLGSRDKECSLKEDRIYALLALAPETLRRKLKVTYGDSPDHYVSVYRSAAGAFLEIIPLDPILVAAHSLGKPTALPSWVPDWSLKTASTPIPTRSSAGHSLGFLRDWAIDKLNENVLRVKGVQVDQVREVIDDYSWHWPDDVCGIGGPADKMLKWLDRCLDLTRRTVNVEEKYKDVFWQTIFAYLEGCNQFNFPPDPVLGLQAHRIRLFENIHRVPLANTALSSKELQASAPTLSYLGLLWRGKVFFSTMQGRIGFAEKGVQVGDSVCLLFGLSKLSILRSRADRMHSFHSQAYVYGLMADAGAALGFLANSKMLVEKMQDFKIC